MNSVIHIKTNPSLSPKHIEFNKLVHSIEKLRMELTNEEKKLEIFSDYYIKNIIPVKAALCRSKLDMAIALDEMSEGDKLPKTTINELEVIIPELISDSFEQLTPDDITKAIFEKWTNANYDEEIKEAQEEHSTIELKLIMLKELEAGKQNAKIEQQIEYNEERLSKITYKIFKMEEDYA